MLADGGVDRDRWQRMETPDSVLSAMAALTVGPKAPFHQEPSSPMQFAAPQTWMNNVCQADQRARRMQQADLRARRAAHAAQPFVPSPTAPAFVPSPAAPVGPIELLDAQSKLLQGNTPVVPPTPSTPAVVENKPQGGSFKTKPCRSFARTGRCPYPNCRFRHGEPREAHQLKPDSIAVISASNVIDDDDPPPAARGQGQGGVLATAMAEERALRLASAAQLLSDGHPPLPPPAPPGAQAGAFDVNQGGGSAPPGGWPGSQSNHTCRLFEPWAFASGGEIS